MIRKQVRRSPKKRFEKPPVETISLHDFITASVAVWRLMGNSYIKSTANEMNNNSKALMGAWSKERKVFDLAISTEDQETASDMVGFILSEIAMKRLNGARLSEFDQSIGRILQLEQVPVTESGRIAYLPELYARMKRLSDLQNKIRFSKHVGQIKSQIEVKITVINVKTVEGMFRRYGQTYGGGYLVVGIDDEDNLIKYFTKNNPAGVGQRIRIKGKVKAHDQDQSYNCNGTLLNYVKILNQKSSSSIAV